jgi:prepilin-type N-terminal cleavage/methylation domain-containing protein
MVRFLSEAHGPFTNWFLAMMQAKQKDGDSAFTLVELMIVVAIIGVLAAVGLLSYAYLIKKSQAVEAEMALAEVTRLEELYFSMTGTYSSKLDAIGFRPTPPLQYFRVSVQAVNGPEGSMFQVTANPLSGTESDQERYVTRYAYSQAGEKRSGGGEVGGGQGKVSTVTSVGNTGSGESVGGGEKDELSEKMGRTFGPATQGGTVVDFGKPNSLGTVNK